MRWRSPVKRHVLPTSSHYAIISSVLMRFVGFERRRRRPCCLGEIWDRRENTFREPEGSGLTRACCVRCLCDWGYYGTVQAIKNMCRGKLAMQANAGVVWELHFIRVMGKSLSETGLSAWQNSGSAMRDLNSRDLTMPRLPTVLLTLHMISLCGKCTSYSKFPNSLSKG